MNSKGIKELNNIINDSAKDKNDYYQLNKRYQIFIGCFLLVLSLILIGLLIVLNNRLAIQQALIAIAGILIIAALETFKSIREEQKVEFLTPSIKLDNRTVVNGNYYSSQETVSNYTSHQKQNLVEAAAEIQKLLEQLSEYHSTETTKEKMTIAAEVVEEIENSPTLKQRIISAIKIGGMAALESMLTHPAASITLAALAGWQSEKTEDEEE